MKLLLIFILGQTPVYIDSTWQTGFIPRAVSCGLCGNFNPFYKAMDAFFKGNAWNFSEAGWLDTRCGNPYTGSFCVDNGIFKQVTPRDSLYINLKFRIKSLDREYLNRLRIWLLPSTFINQDTVVLDTIYPYISVFLLTHRNGIQDNSIHYLKGWIDLRNSEANLNFNVTSTFNKSDQLINNPDVAIFIGYPDGWFENWHITISVSGYIEIYP